jgi:aspartyl-tRNA(Asn)/glutamyl-tRNA(Gln) amidotransferase subunit A
MMALESTIADAAAALSSEAASAKSLVETAIARMDDPSGEGKRTLIRRNDDRARGLASASDAIRAAGHSRSPIEGLPISVKDLFDLKGETTLAGSIALKGAAPAARDAAVIRRLIAAGAVITGTTNMSEFAFSGLGLNPHYDTPRNPFDRATGRIPGGSSSGAAISVSDGMAVAAIGTDTGGSIRIPPALCGLTGFKPTASRIDREGAIPLSTTLDSIGPIARSVACCAILDAIMAGENPQDLPQALPIRGLRLAVPQTVVLSDMDAHVAKAFGAAVSRLSSAGAVIVDLPLEEFAEIASIYSGGTIVAAEAYHWHRELIEKAGDRYDQRVRQRIITGKAQSASGYLSLIEARANWKRRVERQIAGFDALIMPTVPTIAPEIEPLVRDEGRFFAVNGLMLRNPSVINFLDGCALSVPCHEPGTAPVGLMIAGPAFADPHVLAAGLAIESALSRD